MEKLFHIFVSSTYSDLQDERQRVSEALSKAGNVPEGMEIFPASSQKQLDFIKRVIDRCDYYVLILAGRYGSVTTDGTSYTQLEYDYAISKGLPTLAFLHASPDEIAVNKTDNDTTKASKLASFRNRVEQSSLVDYWTAADQLATKVVAAIAQEISSNPGVGWIRADRAASADVLNEINELRKENNELRNALAATKPIVAVPNLADLTKTFSIKYDYKWGSNSARQSDAIALTWLEILKIVGPQFRTPSNTAAVESALEQYMKDVLGRSFYFITFSQTDKQRVLNQLELLGFMKSAVYTLKNGGQSVFYTLTPKGVAEVLRLNAITV